MISKEYRLSKNCNGTKYEIFRENYSDSIEKYGSVVACQKVLSKKYPGDDWVKIQDIIIKVSDSKFKGSMQAAKWKANLNTIEDLNLMSESRYRVLYWAAYVLED